MTKTPLMDIVNAAADRFDSRPAYLASIEARTELAAFATAEQRSNYKPPAASSPAEQTEDA